MVRYDQNHRARTKDAIVDAASTLLRDRGFTDTTVGNVMKAVGLTHGGFYAHFEDKTAMLKAAVDQAFVESPKNFAALAQMATARVDAGFVAEHYLADRRVADIASGCPAAALVSEMHRQDHAVQANFQAGAQDTMHALASAPGMVREDGSFAWAALAMLVGGLSMMRAMPDGELRTSIRDEIISAMRKLTETGSDAKTPRRKDNSHHEP
jgi:TetR/AcrR family transcriptional regulator, transcriptional repressor for nem operon